METNNSTKQTKIFLTIFFIFITTILVAMTVATFVVINKENSKNEFIKEKDENIMKSEETLKEFLNSFFVKYEISESKNKFYVQNSNWKSYDYKTRKNILKTAATLASQKRKEIYNTQYYSSIEEELPRTQIYSNETEQLLAEYIQQNIDKKSLTSRIKSELKAYHFYEVNENYAKENINDAKINAGTQTKVLETKHPEQKEPNATNIVRTKNTKEFMTKVSKKIKANWKPSGFNKTLKAVVHFKILADGTVENPTISTSSGNEDFDNLSIKTITELGKIEPLSEDLIEQGRDNVEIEFSFDFNYYDPKN